MCQKRKGEKLEFRFRKCVPVDKFIMVKKLQVRRCRQKSNVTETEEGEHKRVGKS